MTDRAAVWELLQNPIVRFYRTPRLEAMWYDRDSPGIEKEATAIIVFAREGLVRPWFEEHGPDAPWLAESWDSGELA